MDSATEAKKQVGLASAAQVESGMVVGLGSGSTAAFTIEEIGRRWRAQELRGIVAVTTSFQSEILADEYSLPQATLNQVERIDLAIDGADEVDPHLNLIKGGGACQTREKLVDSRAERLVIVVDAQKMVDRLGSTMPVPVEVLPDAHRQVQAALRSMGGDPQLRMAQRKAGPVVTDQGNLVLDTTFAQLDDPASCEREVNNIPGVLENGLFIAMADQVLVGEVDVSGRASVRTVG